MRLVKPGGSSSECLPLRRGPRPKTKITPLHIQCTDHGDLAYLDQLIEDVLAWPHIDSRINSDNPASISVRLEENTPASDSAAFITATEFARVIFGLPTIYLSLPLVWAHWAIIRGWAEPHHDRHLGKMPPGAVLVYTPKDRDELAVCYFLFFQAYDSCLQDHSQVNGSANFDA